MSDIWKKNKIIICLVSYVIAIVAIGFFIISPWLVRIQGKSDKIQEKIIDSEINHSRIEKISQMEAIDQKITDKSEAFDVVLPQGQEVNFIQTLESLAKNTGNQISLKIVETEKPVATTPPASSTTSKPVPGQPLKSLQPAKEENIENSLAYTNFLSIEISLTGNYPGLANFINQLENMNYYVDIINLDIKKTTISEKDQGSQSLSPADIFSTDRLAGTDKADETKDKETISSKINVVVYLKK